MKINAISSTPAFGGKILVFDRKDRNSLEIFDSDKIKITEVSEVESKTPMTYVSYYYKNMRGCEGSRYLNIPYTTFVAALNAAKDCGLTKIHEN